MYLTAWIYRKVRIETIGNLTFWFTFCIFGQPWALLKCAAASIKWNPRNPVHPHFCSVRCNVCTSLKLGFRV